jgi:hypothetical protein
MKLKILSRDRVTIDRVWIGIQIYWTITTLTTRIMLSLFYRLHRLL